MTDPFVTRIAGDADAEAAEPERGQHYTCSSNAHRWGFRGGALHMRGAYSVATLGTKRSAACKSY